MYCWNENVTLILYYILRYLTYYYVHNVLNISPLINRNSESTFDIVSRSKLTQIVLDIMKNFLTHRCIHKTIF